MLGKISCKQDEGYMCLRVEKRGIMKGGRALDNEGMALEGVRSRGLMWPDVCQTCMHLVTLELLWAILHHLGLAGLCLCTRLGFHGSSQCLSN